MGLEMFDLFSPKEIGQKAAKQALVMLDADYIKAGTMPVAIENGFGGVIFHEATEPPPIDFAYNPYSIDRIISSFLSGPFSINVFVIREVGSKR